MNKRVHRAGLLALLISACVVAAAPAEETNWGKWGPNDQIGTLNYITPETMKYAASLVKQGKVFSLALKTTQYQPGRSHRFARYMSGSAYGAGDKARFLDDHLSLPCHAATHWDGLGHVFGDGKIYNGYDAETYVTADGALKNGIHHAANKVVARGVLVDVARYKGLERLEAGYVITPEDIKGAARRQGVTFRPGDVILIRTRWLSILSEMHPWALFTEAGQNEFYASEPGIGWEVSQWLKQVRAAAVAVDNVNAEVRPCEPEAARRIGHPEFDQPVTYELIRNQGMIIGELFDLEKLADACAADGVYEFLFVASPLNLTNATASPINPIAIK